MYVIIIMYSPNISSTKSELPKSSARLTPFPSRNSFLITSLMLEDPDTTTVGLPKMNDLKIVGVLDDTLPAIFCIPLLKLVIAPRSPMKGHPPIFPNGNGSEKDSSGVDFGYNIFDKDKFRLIKRKKETKETASVNSNKNLGFLLKPKEENRDDDEEDTTFNVDEHEEGEKVMGFEVIDVGEKNRSLPFFFVVFSFNLNCLLGWILISGVLKLKAIASFEIWSKTTTERIAIPSFIFVV